MPLSEAKALFFSSELKVAWYVFSSDKRYLCNVVEDYANIIILGSAFYYIAFIKIDREIKQISLFLFVLTILDFIHLGLYDLKYFIALKLFIALILTKICTKSKHF